MWKTTIFPDIQYLLPVDLYVIKMYIYSHISIGSSI